MMQVLKLIGCHVAETHSVSLAAAVYEFDPRRRGRIGWDRFHGSGFGVFRGRSWRAGLCSRQAFQGSSASSST